MSQQLRLCDLEPGTEFTYARRRYIKLAYFFKGNRLNNTRYRHHGILHTDGREGWMTGWVRVRVVRTRRQS